MPAATFNPRAWRLCQGAAGFASTAGSGAAGPRDLPDLL